MLLAAFAGVAIPSAAFAHSIDEYLQATLVAIEPADIRLRINLTPGLDVADQVLAMLDRDHDGVISTEVGVAYAAMLKRDLTARLDGREVDLKLARFDAPAPAELRTGWGIIQVEFAAAPGELAAGAHLFTLENRHLPAASAYLFNAAKPASDSVQIGRQLRNDNQSTGEIQFTVHPRNALSKTAKTSLAIAALLAALLAPALHRRKLSSPSAKPDGVVARPPETH
jgi:hypothetical protein